VNRGRANQPAQPLVRRILLGAIVPELVEAHGREFEGQAHNGQRQHPREVPAKWRAVVKTRSVWTSM
jgi:hypothetical protein